MKKTLLVFSMAVFVSILVVPNSVQAQGTFQDVFRGLYGQPGANANELLDVLENIGGFLIVTGGIVAGIALIWAGIVFMSAGSNQTRVGSAKAIFKNGIIGALILFTAGIILSTISNFAFDPLGFFS